MTTAEQYVLDFLKAHTPGHIFNVVEVWYWIMEHKLGGKHGAHLASGKPPSDGIIRRCLKKHGAERLHGGQWRYDVR